MLGEHSQQTRAQFHVAMQDDRGERPHAAWSLVTLGKNQSPSLSRQ